MPTLGDEEDVDDKGPIDYFRRSARGARGRGAVELETLWSLPECGPRLRPFAGGEALVDGIDADGDIGDRARDVVRAGVDEAA